LPPTCVLSWSAGSWPTWGRQRRITESAKTMVQCRTGFIDFYRLEFYFRLQNVHYLPAHAMSLCKSVVKGCLRLSGQSLQRGRPLDGYRCIKACVLRISLMMCRASILLLQMNAMGTSDASRMCSSLHWGYVHGSFN
jgi:hypothetical protein